MSARDITTDNRGNHVHSYPDHAMTGRRALNPGGRSNTSKLTVVTLSPELMPTTFAPVAPPVLAKRRKAGKAARKARRTNR